MFVSVQTTAEAKKIDCNSRIAPVLCKIKQTRVDVNHWRHKVGNKKLPLKRQIYSFDRDRRLHALDRWQVKLTKAKAFYDSLVSWYRSSGAECVHNGEGSWSDPSPKYYGGFQMDLPFQEHHGLEFLRRWGTADHWPALVQIRVTRSVVLSSGWGQWPTTARNCGLLGG